MPGQFCVIHRSNNLSGSLFGDPLPQPPPTTDDTQACRMVAHRPALSFGSVVLVTVDVVLVVAILVVQVMLLRVVADA